MKTKEQKLIDFILEGSQYMMVRIHISIDAHPGEGYGSMQFSEQAEFQKANFEVCSRVFTRAHDLLATLKNEIEPAKK